MKTSKIDKRLHSRYVNKISILRCTKYQTTHPGGNAKNVPADGIHHNAPGGYGRIDGQSQLHVIEPRHVYGPARHHGVLRVERRAPAINLLGRNAGVELIRYDLAEILPGTSGESVVTVQLKLHRRERLETRVPRYVVIEPVVTGVWVLLVIGVRLVDPHELFDGLREVERYLPVRDRPRSGVVTEEGFGTLELHDFDEVLGWVRSESDAFGLIQEMVVHETLLSLIHI